jgi:hypothetical protein
MPIEDGPAFSRIQEKPMSPETLTHEEEALIQGLHEDDQRELRVSILRRRSAGVNLVGRQRRANSDNGSTVPEDFMLPRTESGAHAWILEDMFNAKPVD